MQAIAIEKWFFLFSPELPLIYGAKMSIVKYSKKDAISQRGEALSHSSLVGWLQWI
jgi:hypothetical protein